MLSKGGIEMSYRPSPNDAKKLQKKAAKNRLPVIFTPEQAAIIQAMLDRQDKLEKQLNEYKKGLAEAKAQVNEMYAEHLSKRYKEAVGIKYEDTGVTPGRGASSPVAGDDKGEEQDENQ